MAGEQVFAPSGAPISGRITPAVFPFYTTGEDNLRIVSFNSATGVKLRLVARLLGVNGRPSPADWTHTPNTDRSSASTDYPLSGQTLLNVHVSASAGSPLIGQCFVLVQLIRGLGSAAIVLGTILAGPVTTTQALGFPGSPIQATTDGQGFVRVLTGTTPAAGAEILETVPTGARWALVSARYTLTSSATVGNRRSNFQLKSGATQFYRTANGNTTPESQITGFTVSPNVGYVLSAADLNLTMPTPQDSVLLAGQTFGTTTSGLKVDDQYSAPAYLVREWLDV